MKFKKRWIIITGILLWMGTCSIPEIIHKNEGISESVGSVRDGKLINGWLLPYRGHNFHYFSLSSYYLLNNAYVHSSVYATITEAYKTCETTCPDREFILMECTRRKGGRMIFHWTHQNGLSVDFMTPKLSGHETGAWTDHAGLFHYLFGFDENGRFLLNKKVNTDFETIARHIVALDDAAKANGLRIKKILFHTDLHDELFATEAGNELRARDIRFIPHLNELVNRFHDDHYHVDFEFLN